MFFGKARALRNINHILERIGGGVYKRIDENRELLELLRAKAPRFVAEHPWIGGWINSNDDFFTGLANALPVTDARWPAKSTPAGEFPRPWPSLKNQVAGQGPITLRAYATFAHLHANAEMWEGVMDAFEHAAQKLGYGLTRNVIEEIKIDMLSMQTIGQEVVKARIRHIAPMADLERCAKNANQDEEDLAWVNSIVKALNSLGIYIKRDFVPERWEIK